MISPPSGYLGLLFPTSSFPNTPIKFHRGFEYKSHSFRGLKRPISALGTLDTDSSSSGSDNSVGSSCSPSSVPIHAKSHPVIQFEPVQSNPRSFLVPNHRKTGSKKTPTTEIGKIRGKMRWGCKEMLRKYSRMLQDCVLKGSLKDGKAVQAKVIRSGLDADSHLWTCLVNMYSKFGSFLHARHLLDEMPEGDVVSWTALIAGFVSKGNGKEGLSSFYDMRKGGILPNGFTFATALKACSLCVALEFGKQLHGEVVKFGCLSDIYVGSALVDLYSKCSEMGLAESVFFFMPELNSVSWNALLHGYARVGNTKMTFSGILKEPQVILTGFDNVLIESYLSWFTSLMRMNGACIAADRCFCPFPYSNETFSKPFLRYKLQSRHALVFPTQEISRRNILLGSGAFLVATSPLNYGLLPLPVKAEEDLKDQKDEGEKGVIGAITSLFDPDEKTKLGKVLPKAYLKSAKEVVKTLRDSLKEDPKDSSKFRRIADAAKESIREYLNDWRGQRRVSAEESYMALEKAIRSLASFYSKAGPSASLPEEVKSNILDDLNTAESYL